MLCRSIKDIPVSVLNPGSRFHRVKTRLIHAAAATTECTVCFALGTTVIFLRESSYDWKSPFQHTVKYCSCDSASPQVHQRHHVDTFSNWPTRSDDIFSPNLPSTVTFGSRSAVINMHNASSERNSGTKAAHILKEYSQGEIFKVEF